MAPLKTVISPGRKFTAINEVIFSDGSYTARPCFSLSLCFPRLLICLPLVCSFLPSSITLETLLLLVEKRGLKPDHQKRAMRISISISKKKKKKKQKKKKKKNVICQKRKWHLFFQYLKCLLSQTQRNHGSCLYSPLCTWTRRNSQNANVAVTNVRSLLSDVLFHINLLTRQFLQKLQTHMGCNVHGSQISHLAKHVLEHYS